MKRRRTKHKQAILDAFKEHHLLSAKELVEIITGADQSTIYRNLKRLEEDGVLRSVWLGSVSKYELVEKHGDHDHFVCDDCNKAQSIFIDEEVVKPQLPTDGNFSITVHGRCSDCALK